METDLLMTHHFLCSMWLLLGMKPIFCSAFDIMAVLTAPVNEKTVVVQPNGNNIIRPGQGVSGAIPQPLGRRRFSIQQLGSMNLENRPQGSAYPRIPPQEGTQFLTQKVVETWVKEEPRRHGVSVTYTHTSIHADESFQYR